MSTAIPKDSAVYVRFKDHIIFRNEVHIAEDAAERETMGWLTQEDNETICIIHERALKSHKYTNNKKSGLVLVKSCILEIRALPLQNLRRGSLSCQNDKSTNAEYALQTAKRKTQPK